MKKIIIVGLMVLSLIFCFGCKGKTAEKAGVNSGADSAVESVK